MADWVITGSADQSYDGEGAVSLIDFNTTASVQALILDLHLNYDLPSFPYLSVAFELRGSGFADRLVVQATDDRSLTFAGVTFGADWTTADLLVIRDTGLDNALWGSARRDRFEISGGTDTVIGGGGLDTLAVNYSAQTGRIHTDADGVLAIDGGYSVTFSQVERLDLSLGSGNDSVAGLAGNDILRGGGGADTLRGAGGDDILRGGGDGDRLRGGTGDDFIDGGIDTMLGDPGDDVFAMNAAGDEVLEQANGGRDTVRSTVDVGLEFTNVENATLLGSGDVDVFGSSDANRITGNAGANRLTGRGGKDDIRLGGDNATDGVFFLQGSDSTGLGRDIVRGFDADGEDRFLITALETAFQFKTHGTGSLSQGGFNADIAAALNGRMGAGGDTDVILWNPTGSFLPTADRLLVVDRNNSGSYEVGQDLVIQLRDLSGPLGAGDFIFDTIT